MKILSLIVFLGITVSVSTSLEVCQKTPKWTLSRKVFPKDFPAKIKLVALLTASCGFCQTQAAKALRALLNGTPIGYLISSHRPQNRAGKVIPIGQLYRSLTVENYNVSFIIVNSEDQAGKAKVFERSKLPVLQDIKKINVWGKYKAKVDDMLLFNECNQMVRRLSLPESVVTSGKVREAIIEAYDKDNCGCKAGSKKN